MQCNADYDNVHCIRQMRIIGMGMRQNENEGRDSVTRVSMVINTEIRILVRFQTVIHVFKFQRYMTGKKEKMKRKEKHDNRKDLKEKNQERKQRRK